MEEYLNLGHKQQLQHEQICQRQPLISPDFDGFKSQANQLSSKFFQEAAEDGLDIKQYACKTERQVVVDILAMFQSSESPSFIHNAKNFWVQRTPLKVAHLTPQALLQGLDTVLEFANVLDLTKQMLQGL